MQELVAQVLLLASIIALWWVFFFIHREHRIDITRDRLFQVRDNLFDEAAKGTLSFDDKAYGIARTTLNGMIRFAHELNLMQVLVSFVMYRYGFKKHAVETYEQQLSGALKELSLEGRHAVLTALAQAHLIILKQLIHTSIFLWPLLMPIILVFMARHKVNNLIRRYLRGREHKYPWPILDALANQIAHQEQSRA